MANVVDIHLALPRFGGGTVPVCDPLFNHSTQKYKRTIDRGSVTCVDCLSIIKEYHM